VDQKFLRNAFESSLFPEAAPELLKELVSHARFKKYKKGEALFSEGELGEELHVIRKGSVKVSRKDSAGVDVTQSYVAAGNMVGEMALLSEDTVARNATVSAAVGCETIVLDKATFRKVLNASPEILARVRELAQKRRVENIISTQDRLTGKLLDFIIQEGLTDADNVLVIDSDSCVACDNCEKACAGTHGGYSRLDRKGGKSFAAIQIPISCRHCENP